MNTYNSLDNSMGEYPEYSEYSYGNNTHDNNYGYMYKNVYPILLVSTTFLCSFFIVKCMIKYKNHINDNMDEQWGNNSPNPVRRRRISDRYRNRNRNEDDMTQYINEYNRNYDSNNPVDNVNIEWIKVTDKSIINKITDDKHPCCICLENIKQDECIGKLPCEHIYHYNCIEEWLMKTEYIQSCPLCKDPICPDIEV